MILGNSTAGARIELLDELQDLAQVLFFELSLFQNGFVIAIP
ncbi:Uncharacterised protein [Vibrio cholerae]|nr:Uncharacterised protein [Vibrio cholerae]